MPQLPADFFIRNSTTNIRAVTYLLETGYNKSPSIESYGGRNISRDDTNSTNLFQVLSKSIYDQTQGSLANRNINRNIRALMAMIDISKPYIWVVSTEYLPYSDQVQVSFRINGCVNVTEVSLLLNGERIAIVS